MRGLFLMENTYHTKLLDHRIMSLTTKLVQTLSSIFNLPTHKLRIKSRLSTNTTACIDTSAFLRSLFLSSGSTSNHTSQDEAFSESSGLKYVNHHRQAAHSRPSKHRKFRSFPNNLAAAVQTHGSTSPLLMSDSVPIPDLIPSTFSASAPIIRPHPIEPIKLLPHSHSDPLSARRKRPSQSRLLPHALVISGLEYATDLTQRTFANVLTERQVILESKQSRAPEGTNNRESDTDDDHGTWNLPDSFITVYVCPLNARERPSIHKTLVCIIHNSVCFNYDDKHLLPVGQICYEHQYLHRSGDST